MSIYDMDKKTLKRYNQLMDELDGNLELKVSIQEALMTELIEQVFINKLNSDIENELDREV